MTTIKSVIKSVTEAQFREVWVSMLWRAMAKTGKGYRRYTLKNQPPKGASGWRGERRPDKNGMMSTKLARRLAQRCQVA
jgi:hypothetical protein